MFGLQRYAASQLRRLPKVASFVKSLAHNISPETVVLLDYPIVLKQRWDSYNPHLYKIINGRRDAYRAQLQSFLALLPDFCRIPARNQPSSSSEPCWINGWMPALDGVALYSFMVSNNPKMFLEVGSGNSTKFARKAISDYKLRTKIVSIDPHPRRDVDAICDEVIRMPLEAVNLEIFDRLDLGDILYVDSSHRIFMNSDAMVVFLDVFPRLKPGVLVEIHDILLPYDYPKEWITRYYSEQYVLAAYLLANGSRFDIILPNTFISRDDELKRILDPLWATTEMEGVETHGCSFWLQTK